MSKMFANSDFDQDISNWNIPIDASVSEMFN
jgi:hypothetical protein